MKQQLVQKGAAFARPPCVPIRPCVACALVTENAFEGLRAESLFFADSSAFCKRPLWLSFAACSSSTFYPAGTEATVAWVSPACSPLCRAKSRLPTTHRPVFLPQSLSSYVACTPVVSLVVFVDDTGCSRSSFTAGTPNFKPCARSTSYSILKQPSTHSTF
jgi:hypothetical protein